MFFDSNYSIKNISGSLMESFLAKVHDEYTREEAKDFVEHHRKFKKPFWGVIYNNRVVASVTVRPIDIDNFNVMPPNIREPYRKYDFKEILNVYVLRDQRGLNLSFLLLKVVLEYFKNNAFLLWVFKNNKPANKVYEKLGFKVIWSAKGDDIHWMAREPYSFL